MLPQFETGIDKTQDYLCFEVRNSVGEFRHIFHFIHAIL